MHDRVRHGAHISIGGLERGETLQTGLGLIRMPRYHVQADLAERKLVTILPDFPPSPTPVSLLYPHSRQLSPRVRVFIDWVTQELAAPREDTGC